MSPNTSQPFTLNRPDGSAIEFPLLTPSDRIAFRNEFRLWRKMQIIANLRLIGANGADVLKALNDFDARRLPERDVERWVDEPEGQAAAILLSMEHVKANATDNDVDALGLTDRERHEVAAGVMGFKLVPVTDDDGEKKPDPTTAGTEPTGEASLTTSPAISDPAPTP